LANREVSAKIEMMKVNTDTKKIEELLERGVAEVIVKKDLEKKLLAGKKLRIKFGVDPSKPDIHLGHTVPFKKLQEFQKMGHQIVFIIGDFTGRIGDPSGRSKTRPQLSVEEVKKNAQTYIEQVKKVLDIGKIEIRRNSEWYDKMAPDDFMKLFSKITLARILERDDFEKRLKNKIDIYPHEIIYPILQGYDSIIIKADVEIGGNDQTFNMLVGRKLQKRFNQPQQDVLTTLLLVGLDGKKKMSKSLGNYIGIIEPAQEQYGKIMSIPDKLIIHYFELATDVSLNEISEMEKGLKTGALNPMDIKMRLAQEIVKRYHGKKAALFAKKEFEKVFKEKKIPSKIPSARISEKSLNILNLLTKIKIAPSKSEAKRLILQKGVKIDNNVQKDWRERIEIKKGMLIQVGKRKFIKIV
jgi:tyrosyl-tRNA synthetase